jgi:tetratricopeptide (TPR) repeat protein
MLPLIIPPIVLVLCLGFLVWFLSKKSADPELQERLAALDQGGRPKRFLFVFSQDWALRLLERMMQRLKLLSLKFHNRFQEFSNFLRRKRQEATTGNDAASQAEGGELVSVETEDKDHFWDRWHRRHRASLEYEGSESTAPIEKEVGERGPEEVSVSISRSDQEIIADKPASRFSNLKKRVASLAQGETEQRFVRKKQSIVPSRKLLSEEELIDRIAKNPKDSASYEELGDYYLANENLEDAKACYRQVIKLSPLNREVKDKVRKLERLLVQREKHRS